MDGDPLNVVAIHCRGGKGRTGTLVSAWLLRSGVFDNAKASLQYFGERRTDFSEGSKFQGVETPSQQRYVEYYETILKNGGLVPDPVPVRVRSLQIEAIKGVGRGDGSDLSLQILCDKRVIFESSLESGSSVEAAFNSDEDKVTLCFAQDVCPLFSGDVAFKFHCKTKMKLKKLYGHCLFFFHFHTGFIGKQARLRLTREELDNPHKKKHQKVFHKPFAVEVFFDQA
eukprot:m.139826 g.139826  ORF g.139826 m.139826 type:complete len:227 (+) comp38282_c0_seq1:918-1598(+)